MEEKNNTTLAATNRRKRKRSVSLDELNQDLLERILSWLPPSTFFRLRSVCKRWSAVATSPTFRIACSQIPRREPWFLMAGPDHHRRTVVFDGSDGNWKNLDHPKSFRQNPVPVASAGGLVCYRTVSGEFVVSNPVTGVSRELPPPASLVGQSHPPIHAIAMTTSSSSSSTYSSSSDLYRLLIVSGEFPNLAANVYDSEGGKWREEFNLIRKAPTSSSDSDEPTYFLSKTGDVVSTNMQRSPWKQYSSVIVTDEQGEEVIYLLSPSGAVVACNISRRTFSEHPRLVPIDVEHSLDVVSCNGELLVVVLLDFLESSSLRVWRFAGTAWQQVASMPPAMSHGFYGKKADINCAGFDDTIVVGVNVNGGGEANAWFGCRLSSDSWFELPECKVAGTAVDCSSAFSFQPRIEACV